MHSALERQAQHIPDAIAITAPGRAPLTYGRLWRCIQETVQSLHAMGIGRHDRVALVLPDGPEMAVAFLAVTATATCAPLNPAYRAPEFAMYCADLQATALIVHSDIESPACTVASARGLPLIELRPMPAAAAGLFTLQGSPGVPACAGFAQPDDVALVLHTSGTTAQPKRVPLTQTNLWASACHIADALALNPWDRCLNIMPLFHVHGLIGAVLASLVAGASVVCTPGMQAFDFFAWMEECRPTWYTAVPTLHQMILASASRHTDVITRCPLRLIRSCSAPLPRQVMVELERMFHTPVLEAYGMTEAAHQITSNPLPPGQRKAGSVGVAAGPEVAIMDEVGRLLPVGETGEVVVRGANVTPGYEQNPEANACAFSGGWFRTGDVGFMDPDGTLFITGRLKEMINRGGEKIAPREVDEVLLEHEAVAQAVTFAMPHPQLGEDIAAAVVLRSNATATERDLCAFVAERLADFKVPCRVLCVAELPRSTTGKLQRIGLAEKLGLMAAEPSASPVPFVAPYTPVEVTLATIWAQVLGLERVGVHDDFLALGGHSLLATQIITRVRETWHVDVPMRALLEASTVARMAMVIVQAQAAQIDSDTLADLLSTVEGPSEDESRIQAMREAP